MNGECDPEKQLQELIARYPEELAKDSIKVEISGVLLDYLARSQQNIENLLLRHPALYQSLFVASQPLDSTFTLMKAVLNNDKTRDRVRRASVKYGLRELTQLIDRIDSEWRLRSSPRSSSPVDKLANHRVEGVVWQLSDIHFGKLNHLGLSATNLAQALNNIVRTTPEFEPRLIIVSGDVSSTAASDELKEFLDFCESLGALLWDDHRPHRFLVVPGNHETTWLENGIADKLANFKTIVADSKKVVTPFWAGRKIETDSDGTVSVHRFYADESQDVPPFALVRDKRLDLRILLLVSAYYSGFVPEPVRNILDRIHQDEDIDAHCLENLLREDKGDLSNGYLSHIKDNIWRHESTTIAVTHHNLGQFGLETCQNPNARALLKTLAEKDIWLVLHGHTHLMETGTVVRKPTLKEAYPVPCPSLSGKPAPGNVNGFMMHLIGPTGEPRRVTSVVWNIDESRNFTPDSAHLSVRHRFLISKNGLKVQYQMAKKVRTPAS